LLLALLALAIVAAALAAPLLFRAAESWTARRARRRTARRVERRELRDPGRERRAEQRARELLRSVVDPDDWEMYRDLGVLRVWGSDRDGRYAYLVYPHKPIVAYVPDTRELLNEYCVEFPDQTKPYGSTRLPDSDDVLAKWMALTGDERRVIDAANLHLPGRQVDPDRVRRDLWRIAEWERVRARRLQRAAK
jgi:hypothetical protein